MTQQIQKEAGHVSLRQRCYWHYVENELASREETPPLMQYGRTHIPRSFNATATTAQHNKCCSICSIDDAKLLILN